MIFELVNDFAEVLEVMPGSHPRRRILKLLDEAVRRDVHFIDRYPTTLFQCLWNTCWWYDCPEAATFYETPEGGWPSHGPPWARPESKLAFLLESWRSLKRETTPGFPRLRVAGAPTVPLGTALRAVLRGANSVFYKVAFTPEGRVLAADAEGTTWVWDAASGAPLTNYDGFGGRFGSASWACSPDGRLVAGLSAVGPRLGDAATGEPLAPLFPTLSPECLAFSPDGQRIAAGSITGEIGIERLSDRERFTLLRGPEVAVHCLAFFPDGRRLASGSDDGTVRIWDTVTGKQRGCLTGSAARIGSVACASDGRRVVAAGKWEPVLLIWHVDGDPTPHEVPVPLRMINRLTLAPNGRHLACSSGDDRGEIYLIDLEGIDSPRWLKGHEGSVSDLAFSTDGGTLASAGSDNSVRLWDLGSGSSTAPRRIGHRLMVSALACNAEDQRWVSAGLDGSVRVWNGETGGLLVTFPPRRHGPLAVAFSPDGRRVAVADWDGPVRVCDATDGKPLAKCKASRNALAVQFSPDGTRLASPLEKGEVRVWDAGNGREIACFRGHEFGTAVCLAWSPNGTRIASGNPEERAVRIWDASSGKELHCCRGVEDVQNVAFLADGEGIVIEARHEILRRWAPDRPHTLESVRETNLSREDVAAFAAGPERFPWQALVWRAVRVGWGEQEDVVEIRSALTGDTVGWFPSGVDLIRAHPSGRAWAVATHVQVVFFSLVFET
jgi:WD40 repeat protein